MENVNLINFGKIGEDDIGFITPIESNKNIPFNIKRIYYIYDIKTDVTRGKHAHKDLQQVLICVSGNCKISCDDGKKKKIFELNKKNQGLYIKDLIWREMFDFSKDCVLLVLASDFYKERDYIKDYKEFLTLVN
jgi:dTDP-4-dehydrorhamnose 3,5-epimerase-like enzyme